MVWTNEVSGHFELSDTDPISWLDVVARLITKRRLDGFYLSVDGLNRIVQSRMKS